MDTYRKGVKQVSGQMKSAVPSVFELPAAGDDGVHDGVHVEHDQKDDDGDQLNHAGGHAFGVGGRRIRRPVPSCHPHDAGVSGMDVASDRITVKVRNTRRYTATYQSSSESRFRRQRP